MFYKKKTEHKVVFDENVDDKDKKLGSLYIRKSYYAGLGEPQVIDVEIIPRSKHNR